MGNTIFIVWRESVEALLVISILYSWMKTQGTASQGMRYLWIGIGSGVGCAIALAAIMLTIQSQLSGDALEYFEIGLVFAAAILITQMVLWMHKHGRNLKRNLETGMEKNFKTANWLGLAVLVAIAVAREGAEMVIFLYGSAAEQKGMAFLEFSLAVGIGFAIAFSTFLILTKGSRFLSWRIFFRISETVLLLLGAAMLINGIEKLIGLGLLPSLIDPLWNSSFLIDENSISGGVIAALTGYRSHPALTSLAAYLFYWAFIFWMMRPQKSSEKKLNPA